MKKIIYTIILCFITANVCSQNDKSEKKITKKEDPKKLSVNVNLQSMFYWRGAPIAVFSSDAKTPTPVIIGSARYKGKHFNFGLWTGQSFDSQGFKNASIYVGYSLGRLNITLWDSYTYSGITRKRDVLNYTNSDTNHFLDLNLSYQLEKIPLKFFLASIIYGRDGAVVNNEYKNRYSTYFRTDYTLKPIEGVSTTFYASVGGALNPIDQYSFYGTSDATETFGITEVGVDFRKKVKITKTYSTQVSTGIVVSPLNKRVDGIIAIKLL